MTAEVSGDERADRDDSEAASANVIERSCDEEGSNAFAFQIEVDLGMDERHSSWTVAVSDESDDLRPQASFVAPLIGVVRDDELAGCGHAPTLARSRGAAPLCRATPGMIMLTEMEDAQIHESIDKLVQEEHQLWEREAAGRATDEDRRRLEALKVSLDQSWDLLRQRRALREAGRDPDDADVRAPGVVEGYEQ